MSWFPTFTTPAVSWLDEPSIVRGGGPERVATEDPPEDWTPYPLLAFGTPNVSPHDDTTTPTTCHPPMTRSTENVSPTNDTQACG